MFRAQKQIQVRISSRIPVVPAARPIRAPVVAHAITQYFNRPCGYAAPHIENEFGSTRSLRHFRTFDFGRPRSVFIFHSAFPREYNSTNPEEHNTAPANSSVAWSPTPPPIFTPRACCNSKKPSDSSARTAIIPARFSDSISFDRCHDSRLRNTCQPKCR